MSADQYLTIDEGPGQSEIPYFPGSEPHPMDWLLAALQVSITELMASDGAVLQKANTLARLAGLYLRTFRTRELESENKELKRRLTDLEQRVAAAEAAAAVTATPAAVPVEGPDDPRPAHTHAIQSGPESQPNPQPLDGVGDGHEPGPATQTVFLTPARMELPMGAGQPVPGRAGLLPAAQAAGRSPP